MTHVLAVRMVNLLGFYISNIGTSSKGLSGLLRAAEKVLSAMSLYSCKREANNQIAHTMSTLRSCPLLGPSIISVPGKTSRPEALSATDWSGGARSMLKRIFWIEIPPKQRELQFYMHLCFSLLPEPGAIVGESGEDWGRERVHCTDYRGLWLSILLGQVPPQSHCFSVPYRQ